VTTLRTRIAVLEKARAARRVDPRRLATLAAIRSDPAAVMTLAGMRPDPWQAELLRNPPDRTLALTGRQNGKSTADAALCLATAVNRPGSLSLIVSPTQRQSAETFRKVVSLWRAIGSPVRAARLNLTAAELANGSRIVAVPGDPETVRGFSDPALVVIDEAARTADAVLAAVLPMVAVSRGKVVATSTPFGTRGWFWREWTAGAWSNVRVTSAECPRVTPGFLADQRRVLGQVWYDQEHGCSFIADVNAVFSRSDILAAAVDEPPLELALCG
jgi:hypothetical protein